MDFDVVVIGSGIAGLAAAVSAIEHGASSVLVAEAGTVVGGSSRLSTGFMIGAGTRFQTDVGIQDSSDSFFYDYMQLNRWCVEAGLAYAFTHEAGPTIEWLADLGVAFHSGPVVSGAEPAWRGHVAVGGGQGIVDALQHRCDRRGVEFAFDRRVDRLLGSDGRVTGVAVGEDTLEASAVVVATGGFGANDRLLQRHYPSAHHGGLTWYIGSPHAQGDALGLAAQANADVVGHDRGVRLLHAGFTKEAEGLLPGWLVLVNRNGQRVVEELAPYGMLDSVARSQGDELFAVFDMAAAHRARVGVPAPRRRQVPGRPASHSVHWNEDTILARAQSGVLPSASTVEELAGKLDLPPAALAATVRRYNEHCATGYDADFLKPNGCLQPIAEPPFFGARLVPATVGLTGFGLRIDREARVLDPTGTIIPGLFAAGECTGGVVGDQYYGSGNSISNAATFGRIAGRSAAAGR